jgi:hypothetical protein
MWNCQWYVLKGGVWKEHGKVMAHILCKNPKIERFSNTFKDLGTPCFARLADFVSPFHLHLMTCFKGCYLFKIHC